MPNWKRENARRIAKRKNFAAKVPDGWNVVLSFDASMKPCECADPPPWIGGIRSAPVAWVLDKRLIWRYRLVCLLCGIKFSRNVDRRVVERHPGDPTKCLHLDAGHGQHRALKARRQSPTEQAKDRAWLKRRRELLVARHRVFRGQ